MDKRRNFRPFILSFLIIIGIGLFNVVFLLKPIEVDLRVLISDIEAPVVNLGAAIALFWAAYRTKQYAPSSAKVWLLLGWAQLVYALGDIIWAVLEVGFHISPYPSIADLFYLLYYPLVFVAILQYPSRKFLALDWTKRFLDLATNLIGASVLFWNYILGPIIANNVDSPLLEQVLGFAYPLGDLALLFSIIFLFYNRLHGESAGPFLLITFGMVIMVVTDSVFSIQTINGTYTPGSMLDSGWIVQNLLVLAAGVWQIMIVRKMVQEEKISASLVKIANDLFSYYPLIWLNAAVGMFYQSHFNTFPMSFQQIAIVTLVLWFIVLFRQIVTNVETKRLFSQIDGSLKTVTKQTQDLEAANQILTFEISERKKVEERLVYDALHDFLTHLPNRALFIDRLDMAIQRSKRHPEIYFSILFLDLDQFKQINDTKGHSAGDELLIQVAQRLSNCVRASDTVARLGGDEFIILQECVDDDATEFLSANRILNEFKSPLFVDGDNVYISVSIGILPDISGYENSNDVLRDADIAMYHAKESGKARFEVFDPIMRTQAIQRVMIENELRYAIEFKEFKLQYQPIYSLKTDQIMGFEALIRWHNPRMGLVPPGVFIPVAEETGSIIEIGDWVLTEACRQMKKWHDRFPSWNSLSVNVNISGRQFAQPDFVEKLKKNLSDIGLNPTALKLEITESVLLNSQQTESELFSSLRDMGVHLQIDDFGTGYSSLSYIQHIPVDVIKIDRSFIQELGNGKKFVELIHAIIRMAHSLGMETTAEGIETLDQRDVLKSMGCNYGQGFLMSKPLDSQLVELNLLEPGVVAT